jgi:hypothetical protein
MTRDRNELALRPAQIREGREEQPGIGMQGLIEDPVHIGVFGEHTAIHH